MNSPSIRPQHIDEYRVIRPLGSRGNGVFLAHDRNLDRAVVLHLLPQDPAARAALLEAARALARVTDAGLSRVHRIRERGEMPCVVQSFERGERLDSIAPPLPEERVRALGTVLAGALAALHAAGVAHGDVRAARVVVSRSGAPRLIGLRSARADAGPEALEADVRALLALLTSLADEGLGRALRSLSGPGHRPPPAEALRRDLDPRGPERARPSMRPAQPAEEENPYRGLRPFEAAHAENFFGRQREISEAVARLRAAPWLLVAAPSGAGKSSLVRAGLAPAVARGALGEAPMWDVATMVPGRKPLSALAAALSPLLGREPSLLEARLRRDPALAARAARARNGRGLLLFVDQAEDALMLADVAERDAFLAALSGFAALSPGVRAVLTLRGDFLDHLGSLAGAGTLGRDLLRATFILPPMDEAALRMAIVGPARSRGFEMETVGMVDALVAEGKTGGGADVLPLLSFVLGELWSERDRERRVLPEAALARLGGAAAALGRHGDAVLSALSPEQRRGAREVLLSLVIARGTRARRSREDLVGATAPGDGAAPTSAAAREAALEALIRGRLVVAGDTYEIAHEALVRAWPRLRAWLDEVSQEQATSRRMIEAAAEWERLGGGAEGLWSKRQLAELEVLAEASLPKGARHFVAESRAAVRRAGLRQWAIRSLVVSGALVGVALVVVAIKAGERRQARAFVAARLADADIKIDEAAALELQGDAARAEAFGRYDGSDTPGGEELWSQAVLLATRESEAFVAASTELGLALARDPLDPSARSRIADLTYRWVLAAERDHDAKLASNLTARLAQVDDDGSRRARLAAPAHLTVTTDPPGATIALVAIRLDSDGRRVEEAERAIAPGAALELAPGSYVLKASASGRYSTRYPVLLARGQDERVTIPLPSAADVPAGFVFVPAGDSLLGAADGEWVRSGINAQPQHPVHLAGFFIAELEATYRDYLEYLESLPPSERARRQPSNMAFTDPYCRAARSVRRCQDWKRFPVSGIRWEDAQAYVTWLAAGRVPGARLCTEPEWERAARGSDGRVYAGGDVLHPGDANFAETYHTVPAQMGADEVGSFPADVSPFRVRDLTGNVAEWVVTQQGEPAARGGYWDSGPISCRASCRFVDYIGRVEVVGIRACASSPIHFAPAQIRSP